MFFNESMEYATVNVAPTNLGITGDMAGMYRIIAESTEDWYVLREKMMRLEHSALLREDSALLNEGAKEFFGKIADFFKRIWAKIKEMWAKFKATMDSLFMNDKKFIAKYEKTLLTKSVTGFKYTGYAYKSKYDIGGGVAKAVAHSLTLLDNVSSLKNATEASVKAEREKYDEEDAYNEFRGMICGQSAEAGEFSKELNETLKGSDAPEEQEHINVREMIDFIKDYSKGMAAVEKSRENIDKFYASVIKYFDQVAKDIDSTYKTQDNADVKISTYKATGEGDKTRLSVDSAHKGTLGTGMSRESRNSARDMANIKAQILRKHSQIIDQAFGVIIQTAKDKRKEVRTVLAKLISFKATKEEGYNFMSESSLLDRY